MQSILTNAIKQFEYYKSLADKTIAQLTETQLFIKPSSGSNSISIIVQHISGNMLSRWTDFLSTDGEKEWRNRDAEFEETITEKKALLDYWEKGWNCLFTALNSLTGDDLMTIVYIRNMGQTAVDAIARQLCHYSYHVGQIVFMGKMLKDDFESLSIPKNASSQYNDTKFAQDKTIQHFSDGEKK
jgi:Protein of unknown function (DUF1572)